MTTPLRRSDLAPEEPTVRAVLQALYDTGLDDPNHSDAIFVLDELIGLGYEIHLPKRLRPSSPK
jgi:hypothetical protein